MKITNLKINNFGKLSNKEIELQDGINIIYGENESGKSTLLKFIMGMFYGLSKNKNGKFMPDYDRFIPWNGGEFSGKLTYQLDNGQKYEVFRDFKKKNPSIYNENLEDISKAFNIDKTVGNMFFYEQTKVDEVLFLSTIGAMQEETKLEEKEQTTLVQKMSNLASTGEDNVSYQKIMTKLNKRQIEEIGTSRTQDRPINIITRRLEEINIEKEKLANVQNTQTDIEEEKQDLEAIIKEQENELELLKEYKELQEKQDLNKEKIKINENAIKEYNKKIEDLQGNSEETHLEKKSIINKTAVIGSILSIVFVLLSIISIYLIKNDIVTSTCLVLLIVTLIYTGYDWYKKKLKNLSYQKVEDNKNIKLQSELEILEASCKKLMQETTIAKENMEREFKEETEKIRNKYIGIVPIKIIDEILKKDSLIYDINTLQTSISNHKIKLHSNKLDKENTASKLENLANLEEEFADLEEQYNELYNKNEQINLVKQEIEIAYEEMKKNITPEFETNLSKIIEKISQGKYKNVKFDEANGMIVEIENGNYRTANQLSIGTIDQAYLSLRLSAGGQISKESLPIILDETFAYWDNARLENILKYLSEEYQERQIILFTCTNREQEILNKLNIKYNTITL